MSLDFSKILNSLGLVGIFRGLAPADAESVITAAVENGLRIVEIPLNSPDPLVSIKQLAKSFGKDVLVGAGTVTTPSEVIAVAEAGGRLIVTPYARVDVVKKAKELGLVAVSGAMTPTEIAAMYAAGADAVKLFPAEIIPPVAIKAMRAVLPRKLPLIPVGGITLNNMAAFLAAGADGFGLGSALYRVGDSPDSVAENTAAFVKKLQVLKYM
ncbi:MAG: 2-dehydro-3-deoxy-6-phosphogalactonate aldolase [Deltaproteobacteria bacterium]|nr:2-dehydro-3-deoxy-6-phosphogalactonate aldolase [Deltaproteobacteria bacterium]